MKKKEYLMPEYELIQFVKNDIITESDPEHTTVIDDDP